MTSDPLAPAAARPAGVLRLLGLSWAYKRECALALLVQAALVALTIAGLGLSGRAIDVIRHALDPRVPAPRWAFGWSPPPGWSPVNVVVLSGGLVFALALVRAALNWLYAVSTGHLVQVKIVPKLRAEVYGKLQRLSFRFFDATASGAIINRVTQDVQNVRAFVDQVVLQGLSMAMGLLLSVAYMAHTHGPLTLACLASAPLVALTSLRFSRASRPAYEQARALLDRVVTAMAETVQGIAVVKGFARERERAQVFKTAHLELRHQQFRLFREVSRFAPSIDLLSQLNLVVLLAYGGHLVATNQVSLGEAIVFAGLLQQYATAVANVAAIVNSLQQSLISAARVFEVLDAEIEVRSPPCPRSPEPFTPQVDLEGVCFAYGCEGNALEDVTLHVAAGATVVLFGETGSGKSTLLSLLPRFYDPSAGVVSLSGQDLRAYDVSDLRSRVGFMFQESVLFSTSVADNIAFGAPSASAAEIERAARLAAADAFIRQLPSGYETCLEEGGQNLSGGQRQRLALARALLPGPALLLLDDPTAALDAATEAQVISALASAKQGRTTLIATHRIPVCEIADLIVVLERGRIVEQGPPDALARAQGPYARALQLHQDAVASGAGRAPAPSSEEPA